MRCRILNVIPDAEDCKESRRERLAVSQKAALAQSGDLAIAARLRTSEIIVTWPSPVASGASSTSALRAAA
jgi:hypothetical protein